MVFRAFLFFSHIRHYKRTHSSPKSANFCRANNQWRRRKDCPEREITSQQCYLATQVPTKAPREAETVQKQNTTQQAEFRSGQNWENSPKTKHWKARQEAQSGEEWPPSRGFNHLAPRCAWWAGRQVHKGVPGVAHSLDYHHDNFSSLQLAETINRSKKNKQILFSHLVDGVNHLSQATVIIRNTNS